MTGRDPTDPVRGLPILDAARWPDVDQHRRQLLVWPIGSTEQHGPHLPLGTDTFIAAALAARVGQRLPEVAVAPALPYGASGEHRDFPGTLSIGTAALIQVVVEFVRHACTHWAHVLIVNGHGGNLAALKAASELLSYEGYGLTVHHASSNGPRADAHAGYRETSLMLYLAPDSVHLDAARPGAIGPLAGLLPMLQTEGVRKVSENGILGDPTGATAEAGRLDFEAMVETLAAVAANCLTLPAE